MALPEPRIAHYQRWLAQTRGLHFASYDELWRWSVGDLRSFWASIWLRRALAHAFRDRARR